jgi:phage terminase Nu1 subunit (DNA packaging protein)
MIEPYVTAGELAELMGVSLRTVKQWTAEGMPSETWGMRARRYLPSQAMGWAHARGTMRAVNRSRRRTNAAGLEPEE